MKTYDLTLSIPAETIHQLFENVRGAPYSGWVSALDFDLSGGFPGVNDIGTITYDREEDDEGTFGGQMTLTNEKVIAGLLSMSQEHPKRFAKVLKGETDAEDSDIFLQHVVFNKEVYA